VLIYVLRWWPSWISDRYKKPKLCRRPSNDHSWAVWFQLSKWFQRRSVLKHQRYMGTIAITWRPSSVVCKLFTFQASPKPRGQLEPNLAEMFLGWSSTKYLFFVPVGYSTWLPGPIICSDWLKFQRSSSLKLMNWLNPNCNRKIIGMSFTKSVVSEKLEMWKVYRRRTPSDDNSSHGPLVQMN
jgi:hypothetical protein